MHSQMTMIIDPTIYLSNVFLGVLVIHFPFSSCYLSINWDQRIPSVILQAGPSQILAVCKRTLGTKHIIKDSFLSSQVFDLKRTVREQLLVRQGWSAHPP